MLLQSLYKVLFESQQVTLCDIKANKVLWYGAIRDIPFKYLDRTVVSVISCASIINESVIKIDLDD